MIDVCLPHVVEEGEATPSNQVVLVMQLFSGHKDSFVVNMELHIVLADQRSEQIEEYEDEDREFT